MELEAGLGIALAAMVAAFVLDWPRALAGLFLGAIARFLPFGTIVVPLGVVVIAAMGEYVYPIIGRTPHASRGSFLIGLFSVAGTASSLYVSLRNLKDRL
jgi:hypothetical protein